MAVYCFVLDLRRSRFVLLVNAVEFQDAGGGLGEYRFSVFQFGSECAAEVARIYFGLLLRWSSIVHLNTRVSRSSYD